jgi:hypothetical protein
MQLYSAQDSLLVAPPSGAADAVDEISELLYASSGGWPASDVHNGNEISALAMEAAELIVKDGHEVEQESGLPCA